MNTRQIVVLYSMSYPKIWVESGTGIAKPPIVIYPKTHSIAKVTVA